jgi:hypothetical protein
VPDFVKKSLSKYEHPTLKKPQHTPTKATPINYGAKIYMPIPDDNSILLPPEGIKRV